MNRSLTLFPEVDVQNRRSVYSSDMMHPTAPGERLLDGHLEEAVADRTEPGTLGLVPQKRVDHRANDQ